MSYDVKL